MEKRTEGSGASAGAAVRWFDGHLDLAYLAQHGRDLGRPPESCGGTLQPAGVTFPSLRAGGVTRAVATVFVRRGRNDPSADGPWSYTDLPSAFEAACRQVDLYRRWESDGLITLAPKPPQPGVLHVTLALEGADALRSPDDLLFFHEAGVRMIGLAWAEGSLYAGGDQSGGDLTAVGREMVEAIDELPDCVHDVSHLSERAFWSVIERAGRPVVASHSNCRALLTGKVHPERHLSDEQIRALAERDGVIGINLFGRFLTAEPIPPARPGIGEVVGHIEHVAGVAGRRACVGLGSDADSGFSTDLLPVGLERPEDLWRLAEALAEAGWSLSEVRGFTHENWSRLIPV